MIDEIGRTIVILTSSGACSGLNAVIRALDQRVGPGGHGWRVIGILDDALVTTAHGLGICLGD